MKVIIFFLRFDDLSMTPDLNLLQTINYFTVVDYLIFEEKIYLN